jgi:predicted acetyltransferase
MLSLIKPSLRYKQTYLDGISERSPESLKGFLKLLLKKHSSIDQIVNSLAQDFSPILSHFTKAAWHYPNGLTVPCTVWWAIENHTAYIGQIIYRHELPGLEPQPPGHIGIFIRPSYRQQGYGKKILQLAFKHIWKDAAHPLIMSCLCSNQASAALIKSCGGELLTGLAQKYPGRYVYRFHNPYHSLTQNPTQNPSNLFSQSASAV